MAAHAAPLEYSCHCLNVTITPLGEPEPCRDDDEFLTVRVADDGIAIAHPQLTLRDRARAVSATVQHVSLSCLVCNRLVYRVAHSISAGDEAREGPVLPSAEWAEQEVLLSATGKIDVARGCLSGEALRRARESDRFSDTFGILVTAPPPTPGRPSAPPGSPLLPQTASQGPPPAPAYQMAPLPTPALFAPPPFSPSHPAFAHLAQRAQARSEHMRRRAEAEIAALIAARLLELDAADRALKAEVEAIWRAFREGWRAAVDRIPAAARPDDPLALVHANTTMSFDDRPPLVTRRPSLQRAHSSQSQQQIPQVSLLSASLRQTGFRVPPQQPDHQPTADRSPSPPPYAEDNSDDDDPSRPPRYDGFASSSLPAQIRRNMDPNLDISMSMRIESVLAQQQQQAEEEERRARKERRNKKKKVQHEDATVDVPRSSASAAPAPAPPAVVVSPPRASAFKTNGTPEKDKGKRKVTFDEEPEVVVIQQPGPSPSPKPREPVDEDPTEEMAIFELDGLDEAHPALPPPTAPTNGTAVHAPSRAVNGRAARTSALLASMSYRAPSALSTLSASAPPAPAPVETFKPYEEHLRRLVGADLPSHRDGWKKGGKAWKMFARGRRGRSSALDGAQSDGDGDPTDYDDEDDSDDDESPQQPQQGFASSLPIPIGPIASLARARKPALDDVPEDPTTAAPNDPPARQRARDILRRSAEAPDAGMWRSLA